MRKHVQLFFSANSLEQRRNTINICSSKAYDKFTMQCTYWLKSDMIMKATNFQSNLSQ